MSAQCLRFARKRPIRLFDHLVGAGEHPRWEFETQRLCSLEIDDQLEFARLQDRQFGWLSALENAAGIDT